MYPAASTVAPRPPRPPPAPPSLLACFHPAALDPPLSTILINPLVSSTYPSISHFPSRVVPSPSVISPRPPFPVAVHHFPPLSTISRRHPPFPVVIRHIPSPPAISPRRPSFPVVVCHFRSSSAISPPATTPSLPVTVPRHPRSSTAAAVWPWRFCGCFSRRSWPVPAPVCRICVSLEKDTKMEVPYTHIPWL